MWGYVARAEYRKQPVLLRGRGLEDDPLYHRDPACGVAFGTVHPVARLAR